MDKIQRQILRNQRNIMNALRVLIYDSKHSYINREEREALVNGIYDTDDLLNSKQD